MPVAIRPVLFLVPRPLTATWSLSFITYRHPPSRGKCWHNTLVYMAALWAEIKTKNKWFSLGVSVWCCRRFHSWLYFWLYASQYLKGYTTPKSWSYFYLHFRPKGDGVVSILVQDHSWDPKCYVVCTFPLRKRPFLDPESDFPCARIEATTKHRPMFVCTYTYPISGWGV